MKITFIIPLKDDSESCHSLISSIAIQDQTLIERIIVVENGSRKFEPRELKALLSVHQLPEGNRSRARNFGMALATTEYLAFVDADVILPHGWLRGLLSHFDSETLAIQGPVIPTSCHESFLHRLRKERGRLLGAGNLSLARSQECVLNSAAFITTKRVLQMMGGFDERLSRFEDSDLTFRMLGIPGKLKGIRSVSCEVYFSGNMWDYLTREFSRGYAVVRLHEKWSPGGKLVATKSLLKNLLHWPLLFRTARNRYTIMLTILKLVFYFGNMAGLIRMFFNPFEGRKEFRGLRARVEIL